MNLSILTYINHTCVLTVVVSLLCYAYSSVEYACGALEVVDDRRTRFLTDESYLVGAGKME